MRKHTEIVDDLLNEEHRFEETRQHLEGERLYDVKGDRFVQVVKVMRNWNPRQPLKRNCRGSKLLVFANDLERTPVQTETVSSDRDYLCDTCDIYAVEEIDLELMTIPFRGQKHVPQAPAADSEEEEVHVTFPKRMRRQETWSEKQADDIRHYLETLYEKVSANDFLESIVNAMYLSCRENSRYDVKEMLQTKLDYPGAYTVEYISKQFQEHMGPDLRIPEKMKSLSSWLPTFVEAFVAHMENVVAVTTVTVVGVDSMEREVL